LKYWQRQPYCGFGAGAHSFNGTQRWANAHDPAAYVAAVGQNCFPVEQLADVSRADALEEELFLGLRQLAGIELAPIESRYSANLRPRVEELRAQGLVEWNGTRLRLAPDRLTVSNEVFVQLLN
jgi:oxygen-independent coproporphyrinogen-3 oxidase